MISKPLIILSKVYLLRTNVVQRLVITRSIARPVARIEQGAFGVMQLPLLPYSSVCKWCGEVRLGLVEE